MPSIHVIEKFCGGCQRTLPATAFHKNATTPSGLATRCKECCAAWKRSAAGRAATHRYNASVDARETQRRHYESPQGRETRARHAAREEVKQRHVAYKKKYWLQDPSKHRARQAVAHAIKTGKLAVGLCAHAGDECHGRIEAHHHLGYAREHRLDVVWLCSAHHREADAASSRNEANGNPDPGSTCPPGV